MDHSLNTSYCDIDKHFIKRACELACMSVEKNGGPFGCVITDSQGYVLAEGSNCVTETNDPTAHAEMVTIRKACSVLQNYNLNGCRLYSSCEPCPMCLSAIYWSRIQHVFYCNSRRDAKNIGFDDEYIYDEISKKNEERNMILIHIEVDDSLKAFDTWANLTNKIQY
jgi:tRNA(Arg) A34 adenosine deaminase TadA